MPHYYFTPESHRSSVGESVRHLDGQREAAEPGPAPQTPEDGERDARQMQRSVSAASATLPPAGGA